LITNIVFLFPYYFVQNGFGVSSTIIVVSFYVAHIVGTLAFEAAVNRYEEKSSILCAVILLLLVLILILSTVFLPANKFYSIHYIIMLTSIGFLTGKVSNRILYADSI
jgi:hypothetical protein